MPSQDKLIKEGIKYTDSLFDEITRRLEQGVKSSDTLEEFLAKYNKAFPDYDKNPIISLGYDKKMLEIILQETNNHKFSRPAQKELVRATIENKVGENIRSVGEDIRDNVRDIVKEGYNNNLSQGEIAANIADKVSGIKGRRALAIARTEIARTSTISDYIINKEMGATHFYVECRSTACPVCKEAWHDGWTPERDEYFTPNDSSAKGKGWIGDKVYSMEDTAMLPPIHPNCRCIPYFVNENDKGVKGVNEQTGEKNIGRTTTVETKTTEPVKETIDPNDKRALALALSDEKLNAMDFQELADYFGLQYRGESYNILDKVKEHHFVEVFEDGRRMSITFESDAVESYTKKGIATPNQIIAEIMKVPEHNRNETNGIVFKDTNKGLGLIRDGEIIDDVLDSNTLGYNRTRTVTNNDYEHIIIMNPRFFKGSKGRGSKFWIPNDEDIIRWKKNLHHEFEHSGDETQELFLSDEYMPFCWSEEYEEVHNAERYFTEYANSERGESWAEHGGYISYMEANPSEQHRLITVSIYDEEKGFVEKKINYAQYKKMYSKHYEFFMKKHRGEMKFDALN